MRRDAVRAAKFYEQAATAGNAWTMNKVGTMYEHGKGVSIDYQKASQRYEKAAAAGEVFAMYNLISLQRGKGRAKG